MPITMGINIASLRAQRNAADSSRQLMRTFERLSTGQRINHASDDAAGLAIADALRSDQVINTQGIRNLSDGISLLNIADGALEALSSITMRIQELAQQAASGSLSSQQRAVLDKEAQSLSQEFNRVIQTTSFNNINLLNGSNGQLYLQAGYGASAVLNASVGGSVGDGTLGAATSFTTETSSSFHVRLGDLNGDGELDLVTVGLSGASPTATVRMGTGGGSFGSTTSYSMAQSNGANLADINNDGNLDIVTVGGGVVDYRLGTGTGSFGVSVSYTMPIATNDVVVADLNGDGLNDLVTSGNTVDQAYAVRLGRGAGSFASAVSYTFGPGPSLLDMQSADFNGDGKLDLLIAQSGGGPHLALGNGDGTFGARLTVGGVAPERGMAINDMNNDGKLDIAISTHSGPALTYLYTGNGDGTFALRQQIVDVGYSDFGELALADANGDGILDLYNTGITGGTGVITIRSGNGNGTFGASTSYANQLTTSTSLAIGDLNGDGVTDVVTAGIGAGGRASVLLGDSVDGTAVLQAFSLKTMADARQSMSMLERTLERLGRQRGTIGSSLSRIAVANANLSSRNENFASAEANIRDADIASEASALVSRQILLQTAASILTQANQQPALVLLLLK